MPMHQSGLDSPQGLLEQLRIAQMNRAAMQAQQGQGGMGAAGPPMPVGMTPQNAPLPQLGPFVPPPIPSGPTTGELLQQAGPMKTASREEIIADASRVPLSDRMREALNLPAAPDPDLPTREVPAITPRDLAGEHGFNPDAYGANVPLPLRDFTRAMMARRDAAEANAALLAGEEATPSLEAINVVGPFRGRPRTEDQIKRDQAAKAKMRDRATARREKAELFREARAERATPSQFGPTKAMRAEIQANPTGLAAMLVMGGPEAIAAQGVAEEGEAALLRAETEAGTTYQMRVVLGQYLAAAAAAGVTPDPEIVKSMQQQIQDIDFPGPPLTGTLPPGIATPPIPSAPIAPLPVANLTDDEAANIARQSPSRESFIRQYVTQLQLRGVGGVRANELARKAVDKNRRFFVRTAGF